MNRSLLAERSVVVVVVALMVLSVVSVPAAASATATADAGEATPDSEATVSAGESADEESFEVSLGSDRTVDIGETIRLEPEVADESGDVRYDWTHDVDGAYPRESDDESALSLGTMIVPGDYTVTVTATDESGQSVTDTVTVTVTSEFGDTEQIESDETLYGDDIDGVYALEAEEGEAVGMVSGGGMRQAILYDENAQPIRTITAGPDTVLQGTTAEYSGQYYLAITSDPSTHAELSGYTRSQDQSEPNQGQSEATEISPDTSTTGLLTRSDGADWYAVETGEGSLDVSAELSVHALHQEDIELQIYTEDGRAIGDVEPFEGGTTTNQTYASGGGGMFEAQQSAEITDAGTYYVRVSRPSTDREYTVGFTEYELTVDGTEITDAATDAPTATATPSATSTATATPTATETPTQTQTESATPTETETVVTDSPAASTDAVDTSTPESTPTESPTATPTETDSDSAIDSQSDSTATESDSTDSESDSSAGSESDSATDSEPTPTETATATPTPEPTETTATATSGTGDSSESPTTADGDTATASQTATSEPTTTAEAEEDTAAASTDAEESVIDSIVRKLRFVVQSYFW